PGDYLDGNAELREVLNLMASGLFSRGDPTLFKPIVENLCGVDPFLVLADYAAYLACQERVTRAWRDVDLWTAVSILNTARSGRFSSDRAIREYCDGIWRVPQVPVSLDSRAERA